MSGIEIGDVLKRVDERMQTDEKNERNFEDPKHLCPPSLRVRNIGR